MEPRNSVPPVDRERSRIVSRYFNTASLSEKPLAAISGFLIVGVVSISLAFASSGFWQVVSFLAVVVWVLACWHLGTNYRQYYEKYRAPTDGEMDAWLEDVVDDVIRTVADDLQLHTGSSVRPRAVVSIPSERLPRAKTGADGRLRDQRYTVHLLFLAHDMVTTYRCTVDLVRGRLPYGAKHEIFYRDISDVHEDWEDLAVPADDADVGAGGTEREIIRQQVARIISGGDKIVIELGVYSTGRHREPIEIAWPNRDALNELSRMRQRRGS